MDGRRALKLYPVRAKRNFQDCLKLPNGAEERNRTSDLRVTSALLYQLSYFSQAGIILDSMLSTPAIFIQTKGLGTTRDFA